MFRKLITVSILALIVTSTACSKARASATVIPDPIVDAPLASSKGEQVAVLAGGCFWGVEAVFENVKGVIDVKSGYSGGSAKTAEYDKVSSGKTEHAESVRITYDPSQISYGTLLKVFFAVAHDPTELNRQGPDTGPQYRSAIYFSGDEQKRIAEAYVAQLNKAGVFEKLIVTEIRALKLFYDAEDYHQDYLINHPDQPYIVHNDMPKLENLKKQFPALYKAK